MPSDPIGPTGMPECEAYALGHDARNDGKSPDDNPYEWPSDDYQDWAHGWEEADRALDEDYDRKWDERGTED